MRSALRSLTGFGSGIAEIGGGQLTIDVRSVNHRFFEARVKLPTPLIEHASMCEELVRRSVQRGRVEISGRVSGTDFGAAQLDTARIRDALRSLAALRDEVMPGEPVPAALLAGMPGLLRDDAQVPVAEVRRAVELATERACTALLAMRATEGAALAADLRLHIEALRRLRGQALERVPDAVEAARDRLHDRIRRAVEAAGINLDTSRLEHEVALLADRADVAEELARLESHLDQLEGLLESAEPVGRKMDFLLQEVGREVNTLGSKSTDVALARLVVDLKTEVERLREQCQNVL